MDEVKSSISIDLSTRRYLSFKTSKLREKVGEFPSEMFKHFFISLVNGAAMTCHIETKGEILITYLRQLLKILVELYVTQLQSKQIKLIIGVEVEKKFGKKVKPVA